MFHILFGYLNLLKNTKGSINVLIIAKNIERKPGPESLLLFQVNYLGTSIETNVNKN